MLAAEDVNDKFKIYKLNFQLVETEKQFDFMVDQLISFAKREPLRTLAFSLEWSSKNESINKFYLNLVIKYCI